MIEVLQPGFYTTIQDLGRYGVQKFGVPVSGVMDSYSAKLANSLVGNNENAALLEITLSGPKLKFKETTLISITGGMISPKLNDTPLQMNKAIVVKTNDVLSFGKCQYGTRAYLAVYGDLQTEVVMGSRSMYGGITKSFRLDKDVTLPVKNSFLDKDLSTYASVKEDITRFDDERLEVYKGPEYDSLNASQKKQLETKRYTIAKENSRMAYQLEETLANNLEPIITSLVLPGTVQLTPSGKLIVLMRDCQITGGYPRVLQLSESAINRLSQKFTGSALQFDLIG